MFALESVLRYKKKFVQKISLAWFIFKKEIKGIIQHLSQKSHFTSLSKG